MFLKRELAVPEELTVVILLCWLPARMASFVLEVNI
jgi:hypothetical protein